MFFHRRHRESHFPEPCSDSAAGTDLSQGFASVFVTAQDGLTLHVRRYGSGHACAQSIVCLPGLARTAADFHPLATALAADPASPRLVLALDYRGHGQSQYDRNPKNYAIRVALADLSAVLAAFEITSAIFVGTSFGGVLAMRLAVLPPATVAGVNEARTSGLDRVCPAHLARAPRCAHAQSRLWLSAAPPQILASGRRRCRATGHVALPVGTRRAFLC